VQQNHDGLPQKAGFPQEEKICEIHGSWYDPSNPVVKYSGSLKGQEYEWLERETATADLVLVLGTRFTSLGGLSADSLATECAARTLDGTSSQRGGGRGRDGRGGRGRSLGMACVNLHQTAQDGAMSLRVFVPTTCCARCSPSWARRASRGAAGGAAARRASCRARAVLVYSESCLLVPYDARGRVLPQPGDGDGDGDGDAAVAAAAEAPGASQVRKGGAAAAAEGTGALGARAAAARDGGRRHGRRM